MNPVETGGQATFPDRSIHVLRGFGRFFCFGLARDLLARVCRAAHCKMLGQPVHAYRCALPDHPRYSHFSCVAAGQLIENLGFEALVQQPPGFPNTSPAGNGSPAHRAPAAARALRMIPAPPGLRAGRAARPISGGPPRYPRSQRPATPPRPPATGDGVPAATRSPRPRCTTDSPARSLRLVGSPAARARD